MKYILLTAAFMLTTLSIQAQKRGMQISNSNDLAANAAPQDLAAIQAKKMTLALDLTDQQEKQITALLTQNHLTRKENKMTREEYKAMPVEQKMVLRQKRMDEKIATKRAFKKILNEEQYADFEKMAGKKHARNKIRMQRAKRT